MVRLQQLLSKFHRARGSRQPGGDVPRALAVTRCGPCREALRKIFRDAGWVLEVAEDAGAVAGRWSRDGTYAMVFYDRDGMDGHWAADVAALSRMAHRPWVVLLSATADKNLWDEVCRSGGSDILRTPLSRDEVVKAVTTGYSVWRNRQRLRARGDARGKGTGCDGRSAGIYPGAGSEIPSRW